MKPRRVVYAGVIMIVAAVGMNAQDAAHPPSAPARHFTLNECVSEFSPARIESTKAGCQY